MFDGQYVAESALAGMSADADQLLTVGWGSLDVDDVLGLADRLEVLRRRLAAVDQAIVADLDRRSAAERFGIRHTAGLLQSRWRISAAEAAGRVRAGQACGRPESSGGPARPVLAAAARAGAISVEQSGVVLAALDRIPATTPVAAVSRAEEALVGYAADFDPHRLSVIARRMVERADPELAEADEVAQATPTRVAIVAAPGRLVLDPRPAHRCLRVRLADRADPVVRTPPRRSVARG